MELKIGSSFGEYQFDKENTESIKNARLQGRTDSQISCSASTNES
jgi:hypothetical protein